MRTELRSWRRAWPRVGKATVDMEVEAEVVEEEEDVEEEEGGGGGRRRTRRRRRRRMRRTALIKSITTLTWQVGQKQPYRMKA